MEQMKFMVCPHDTAKDPDKWFHFAAYFSKRLNISLKYVQCMDFVEFHSKMTDADVIYANPQDSLQLVEQHDYIPLVHSSNLFDEIVYIANSEQQPVELTKIDQQECLSCNQMMVTRVGIKGLMNQQLSPKAIENRDSWLAVLSSVYKGEKPYGFLYKDFYDGLNKLSKSVIVKLGETTDQSIFHSIFIKKQHAAQSQRFTERFMTTHEESEGQQILAKVNIEKFIPTNVDEIKQFSGLLDLGSELMQKN